MNILTYKLYDYLYVYRFTAPLGPDASYRYIKLNDPAWTVCGIFTG